MESSGLRGGQCPVCTSKDVYCDDNFSLPFAEIRKPFAGILLKRSHFFPKIAPVQTYVCGVCGYIERYVSNEKDLDYIKSNWRQVGNKTKRKRGDS
jgi:hypothetical protein